jgi:2-iminoacetate synthase
MDYALEDTREKGEEVIKAEINKILSDKVKNIAIKNIEEIEKGKRDFRF